MWIPIFIKSKRNKFKVRVGICNDIRGEAVFEINENRFFREANSFGIDQSVLKRKSIRNCDFYIFELTFGEKKRFVISKENFIKNAWLYPKKDSPDYKANGDVFEPKLVMEMSKYEELQEKQKSKAEKDLEILKAAII